MDKQSVPQDQSTTYEGLKRLVYAVDEDGKYIGVTSSGWEVESFSTELAVAEMNRQRDDAWRRARAGLTSPLEYHMFRNRMDFDTLAMTTGLWRWRIRRHFKPQVFAKLDDAMLSRYASVMGISVQSLKQLPEQP
jgi:hypothetical protein